MSPRFVSTTAFWLVGTASSVAVAGSLALFWKKRRQQYAVETTDGSSNQDNIRVVLRDDGEEFELPQHLRREIEKEQRRQEKIPMLAMKSPMYDNIFMLDPQGTLLCTISKKKARWYINKKLARWTDKEETTIQLLFEPSHRSNQSSSNDADDDKFFNKSVKENICVVCGHDQYHMRHYVVPYSCRSLFPNKYKMHMAHDVVILCADCHLVCKNLATKRMKKLERQCRKDPNTGIPHFVDKEMYKIKSWALALLRRRDQLPPAVMERYESHIRNYANLTEDQELTSSILESCTEVETEIPNPDFVPAAEIIVQSLCQVDASIETFVKDWRRHFVETMQPQYLPIGWHVDSSVQCQSAERKEGS